MTSRQSLLCSGGGGGSACPHQLAWSSAAAAAVRSPIARSFAPPLPVSATAARPGDRRAEGGRTEAEAGAGRRRRRRGCSCRGSLCPPVRPCVNSWPGGVIGFCWSSSSSSSSSVCLPPSFLDQGQRARLLAHTRRVNCLSYARGRRVHSAF